MSSNRNSVTPFTRASLEDLNDSLGVTQFPSSTSWYQVIGGLIVQGGLVEVLGGATSAIALPAPYEKQVLGLFIQPIDAADNGGYPSAITLSSYDLVNGADDRSYYWWSVGV